MKIRKLKEYISDITHGKTVTQLGVMDDPLLVTLNGEQTNIVRYIEELTKFAVDSSTQVFYELLQNANDAGASVFYVFFDKENLLFVNNAKPFKTNINNEKGQLRTFLAKNKSDKEEEQGDIGKYGQGAKLLYDLLTDNDSVKKEQRLKNAILNKLKGPVLFSWNQWSEIERLSIHNEYLPDDYKNENINLLTKIIYSYYPSMPFEHIFTKDGEKREIFTSEDIANFINYFKDVFSKQENIGLKNNLNQGTAIYLKLGKGQFEKLTDSLQTGVKAGIATSLIFLNGKIKHVVVQGEQINKINFKKENIKGLDNGPNVEIGYPLTVNKEIYPEISNLFQYFPITKETRGFSFVINTPEISLNQSRQELDIDDKFNFNAIKHYGREIIELLVYKKSIRDEFLVLYSKLLESKEAKSFDTAYHDLLYKPIIEGLKSNIPLVNNQFTDNYSDAILKRTALPVCLNELGIEKKFIDDRISIEYENEFKEKLNVISWRINDILKKANPDLLKQWIQKLNNEDYNNLINELSVSDNIFNVPFIKFNNNEVFSLNEVKNNEQLLLCDGRLLSTHKILKELGFNCGGIELLEFEKFKKLNLEFSDKELFNKINLKLIEPELLPQKKRKLLEVFYNDFDDNIELRSELKIFKNKQGEFKTLNQLLYNTIEIAPSGLLEKYQISNSEILEPEAYDGLFIDNKTELLPLLYSDWDKIKNNNTQIKRNIIQTYQDIDYIISNTVEHIQEEYPINDLSVFLSDSDDWVTEDKLFINDYMVQLSDKLYGKIKHLIIRISSFQVIDKDQIKSISNLKYISIYNKTLRNIVDNLTYDKFSLKEDELITLIELGNFLSYFIIIEEAEDGYTIEKKLNQKQFYSEDKKINDFLQNNDTYYILPDKIKASFIKTNSIDENIVYGDNLLRELISVYGAELAFINAVLQTPDLNIKQQYLTTIESIILNSTSQYNSNSFEYKVFKIAQNIQLQSEIKSKIFIDNEPISSFSYQERFYVKDIRFELSYILDKYIGKSDVFERLKSNFPGVLQGIFDTEQVPLNKIISELKEIQNLNRPVQIAFLIALKLSDKEENESFELSEFTYIGDKIELLEFLYKNQMIGFQKHFVFGNFNLDIHYFNNPNEQLLLPKEKSPYWVVDWIKQDNKKLDFLNVCDRNSKIKENALAFRNDFVKKYIWNSDIINNKDICNSTLEWCSNQKQNEKSIDNLKRLIKTYIDKHDKLPDYLISFNKETGKKLIEVDLNNALIVQDNNSEENIKLLIEKYPNFQYIVFDYISDKQVEKCSENGFGKLTMDRKFLSDALINAKEWTQNPYKEWISNSKIKHRIFLSDEKIPYQYYAIVNGQEYDLKTINEGEITHEIVRELNHIYISQSAIESQSVLNLLKENSEEIELNDNELVELFDLFEKENRELLQEIEKNNKSNEEIIQLIKNESVISKNIELINIASNNNIDANKLKDLIENGGGEGKYNLSRDLNKKELDALNKILKSINEDLLLKLAENIDLLKKLADDLDETDARKNPVTGFIGEMLVLHWLIKKYGEASVKYVAKEKAELDIILKRNDREFQIDVKTTIKPLKELSGAVAFYIKRSQYEYIKLNKLENYYITRLSLKDFGLEGLAKKYKKENIKDNEIQDAIKKEVKTFLEYDVSLNNFSKNIMIFRVRYDDFFSEPF